MRQLAEASRGQPPLAPETAAVVRARLSAAVPEMIEVIGRGVPEYARQEHPDYSQRLAGAVTGAVAQFIAHLAQPGRSTQAITAEFRAIGGTAAREGRTLDALQDALRLGARVAWRWLCEADAGLDLRELSRVGEAIFAYLDELAAACAQGYAEARVQAAGERQRRLLGMILSDPQTVRYRLRQIQELFGDQLRDPDLRFELQLALRVRKLDGSRVTGRGTLPRSVLMDTEAAADGQP